MSIKNARSTDPNPTRAEVFVLNIAGSLPTVRPLYSQICGHLPSSVASALYKKDRSGSNSRQHGSGQEAFHTIGSDPSRKFGHRAGNVTIDLDEIDNMNVTTKRNAGSSTESILPTNNQQSQSLSAVNASKAPSVDTTEVHGEHGIQVRQDFSLGFDALSAQDALAFERSRRPLT